MKEMITARNISKTYKNLPVLKNIDMTIYEGEIYGFLGKNGAGKTTFMKLLLNLLKPSSGEIEIDGEAICPDSCSYLSKIGSLIEYPIFYEKLTALQNLELHCEYFQTGKAHIHEVLEMTGLEPENQQPVEHFSLGMKQRLGIARAIVTKPQILILDEPVNGLDPVGIHDMREILLTLKNEWNTSILISSHIVSELEYLADRVGILHHGELAAESKLENIKEKNLETYFINTIKGGQTA